MDRELEVKVLNIDVEEVESNLISIGAKLISRENQKNFLIDSNDKSIESDKNSYLRIRETIDLNTGNIKNTLTLKQNVSKDIVRKNIEISTDIEDRESLLSILDILGYHVINEGFKDRISYEYEGIRFDIDTWDEKTYPYPYMEIEVKDEDDLDRAITILNIDSKNISTKSIVELRKDLGIIS